MMEFEQDEKNDNSNSRIRGRTQIIADILHHCKENKKKSHVMQKANLNFDQVNHYLGDLQGRGLVEPSFTDGNRIYRTTNRGREFLDRYQKLIGFFKRPKSNENSKSDRADINQADPIVHINKKTNKSLTISFLLVVSLSMILSPGMQTIMTTTSILQHPYQLAYAQEEDTDKNQSELQSIISTTEDQEEIEEGQASNDKEDEDDNSRVSDAADVDKGNDSQLETEEDETKGEEPDEVETPVEPVEAIVPQDNSSIEESKSMQAQRELPDGDCLFDPSLPKCAPINGKCPNDFNMNEDGQCYPDKPCPRGYERRDNDETGACLSVSEKHLKVIVDVKGADRAGKISVESKDGAGDSRFVDNIQGTHTFKFYKNSMPVGAEFEACAYSYKLDKELCAKGKNGPENEPEKVNISFNAKSERGLKVVVRIVSEDGQGKLRVTSEETGKTLSKTVNNLNGKHTFNFKAREVSVGGAFEACAYSDKLDKEHCAQGTNGPESEPEEVGIIFREPPPT
jgi:predicted transcriptional regulator